MAPPYTGKGTVPPTPERNEDGYFTFPRLLLSVPLSACGKHDALAPGGQPCCAPCPWAQRGGSARLSPSALCLSPLQNAGPSLQDEWGASRTLTGSPYPQTGQESPRSFPGRTQTSFAQAGKAVVLPSPSVFWVNFLPRQPKASPPAALLLPQPWQGMRPGQLCPSYCRFSLIHSK